MIIVYSTKSCGKCMVVKKILESKKIEFKNVYVGEAEVPEDITRVPTLVTDDGLKYEDSDAIVYVRSL